MFGTPAEYEFSKKLIITNNRRLAIASDHSGYEAKEIFKERAIASGFKVDDFGCFSTSACDYNDFVFQQQGQ